MSGPAFDQRPGDLEATRGLPAISVCGTRRPGPDDADALAGWRVLVLISEAGALQQLVLTPAEAEALARQLEGYAGICRGEHAALQQRRREQAAGTARC